MTADDKSPSPTKDKQEKSASTEDYAQQEFEPFEAAFSRETWNCFIPQAFTALAIAKNILIKTKPELVKVVRKSIDDDGAETLAKFAAAAGEAAQVFEKYAKLLRTAQVRVFIAEAITELEDRCHV